VIEVLSEVGLRFSKRGPSGAKQAVRTPLNTIGASSDRAAELPSPDKRGYRQLEITQFPSSEKVISPELAGLFDVPAAL
jgi:hypothetical protein